MIDLRRYADSYRARLVIGYVLIAVVFAAAWAWSLYTPLTQAALHQQQRNLTAVAQAASLVAADSKSTPEQFAKQLVARTDLRLTVVAPDGHVLADSAIDPKTMENHGTRPEITAALRGRVGVDRRRSATQGIDELYVAVPATIGGQRVALRVSQPLTEIEAVAAQSRRVGLWLLALSLAITIVIAVWASAAASRPVAALSEVAGRMAAGNLSVDVPEVPADLQLLADALSTLRRQMAARLEALEAEQRTLRTALDGLADAIFLLEDDVVRFANAAAGRIFRMPASGWRDLTLDHAGLPESVSCVVLDHLGQDVPLTTELEPDPRGRTLRLLVVPLDAGQPHGRTLVVVSDITERARLDHVRRDFVANASHELKTPVAGIQLLAESAGTAASDGDIETSLAFTAQIEAEASRLKRLVGDLLDLSRLETAPAPGSVADVRATIDNTVVGHRTAATRKELVLAADLSAIRGLDVFAAADPTDIAVALDNLVDNAINYTEAGTVRVTVHADEALVTIRVTDTGPGIAPEHLARIFERFYRVDRARSRDSGGTGLGLSLVRHVVERSGGSVSVSSEVGTGTSFTIRLPRAL